MGINTEWTWLYRNSETKARAEVLKSLYIFKIVCLNDPPKMVHRSIQHGGKPECNISGGGKGIQMTKNRISVKILSVEK